MTQDYRLVSELLRPGDRLPCPDDADPVVEPSEHPGLVRVTYLKPVKRVPLQDNSAVADDSSVAYVE